MSGTTRALSSITARQNRGNVDFYWAGSFNYKLGVRFFKTDDYSEGKCDTAIDFQLKIISTSLKNMPCYQEVLVIRESETMQRTNNRPQMCVSLHLFSPEDMKIHIR